MNLEQAQINKMAMELALKARRELGWELIATRKDIGEYLNISPSTVDRLLNRLPHQKKYCLGKVLLELPNFYSENPDVLLNPRAAGETPSSARNEVGDNVLSMALNSTLDLQSLI